MDYLCAEFSMVYLFHFQSIIFSLNFQSEILLSIIERMWAFIECELPVGLYRQAMGSLHFGIASFMQMKEAIGPGSIVAASDLKTPGPARRIQSRCRICELPPRRWRPRSIVHCYTGSSAPNLTRIAARASGI
jgi:hypothetical protein